MPTDVERRQNWEAILSNYRHSSTNSICIKHFDPNDLIVRKNNRRILKTSAVPSIFESPAILKPTHAAEPDIETNFNADATEIGDGISADETVNHTETDTSICERCLFLNDQLLVAHKRSTELQSENIQNAIKIRQLSDEFQALKIQLERSDLARFALNSNFPDEKVIFVDI